MAVELTESAKRKRHKGIAEGKIDPSSRKFSKRTKAPGPSSMKSNMKASKDGAAAARMAADKALGITRR